MKATLWLLLSFLSLSVHALEMGEKLDRWTLPDQFDQPFELNDEVKVILVASSTGAARVVDAAIKTGWCTAAGRSAMCRAVAT